MQIKVKEHYKTKSFQLGMATHTSLYHINTNKVLIYVVAYVLTKYLYMIPSFFLFLINTQGMVGEIKLKRTK